jgi:hypothetical protein
VAEPLGLDTAGAASGIVEVATAGMAAAARMHLSEQGRDPAGFALVAFGGAGPVHAYGLAKQLKITRIVVPMRAGVMSAYGFLVAPPTVDQARSLPSALTEVDWERVTALYDEMADPSTDPRKSSPGGFRPSCPATTSRWGASPSTAIRDAASATSGSPATAGSRPRCGTATGCDPERSSRDRRCSKNASPRARSDRSAGFASTAI